MREFINLGKQIIGGVLSARLVLAVLILKYFTDFSEEQIQQFTALEELYTEWNAKINVISRKDMDHFYEHHVLHSLAIAEFIDFKDGLQVMDLGSGGVHWVACVCAFRRPRVAAGAAVATHNLVPGCENRRVVGDKPCLS